MRRENSGKEEKKLGRCVWIARSKCTERSVGWRPLTGFWEIGVAEDP